jgi:sporulation protein YlmC with PRC-barrel domain
MVKVEKYKNKGDSTIMFRSLRDLFSYDIQATDGKIGKVRDLYFDEEEWETRYLVIDTGSWILGKEVLVIPDALGQPNWAKESLPVELTRKQVKESPDVSTVLPISRKHQIALHTYYNWRPYWAPVTPLSTSTMTTTATITQNEKRLQDEKKKAIERLFQHDSALRSAKEVIGYTTNGEDGELGQIDDIILDIETWKLVYFVLDTSSWLAKGKKTLIAISWINRISYHDQEVQLDLSQNIIEDSPPFDPNTPINRSFEEVLYDYHGRPYVWAEKSIGNE